MSNAANIENAQDLLDYSPDAFGVLLGRDYKSYCSGSDTLVALGIWDNDGQVSDFGLELIADAQRWGL